jgi:hypothetical protein
MYFDAVVVEFKTFYFYCQPAQNQPKSQFLFHKKYSPRDLCITTLFSTALHCARVLRLSGAFLYLGSFRIFSGTHLGKKYTNVTANIGYHPQFNALVSFEDYM